MDTYKEQGYKLGQARGSWVFDGNTDTTTYKWVLAGYDDGDPEVMDLCPNPLSGEWAGESISEIFDLKAGEDYPNDEDLEDFETAFHIGFWDIVITTAQTMVGD